MSSQERHVYMSKYPYALWIATVCLPLLGACVGTRFWAGEERSGSAAIAFVDVNVVPMVEAGSILPAQTVLVRDGRIVAIGASAEVRIPEGSLRIDGAGKYLMPGLADMHAHLEYSRDPEILTLFLANGVTTVRNMDGRPYILEWKKRIAGGQLLGPTIYTAGPILDGNPPLLPDNTVIRTPDEARTAVIAQHAAGYDFIKVYVNLGPEAYRAVLATAQERGLPVAGHVPRRVDLGEALAGGQVAIEHLVDYGDWIEAESSPFRNRWHWSKLYLGMPTDAAKTVTAAERIARSGVWTVPTLVQAERAIAPPDTVRAWLAAPELAYIPAEGRAEWARRIQRTTARMDTADWRLVEQGKANRNRLVRALHDAGAKLLIGTDTPNPFVVPGLSVVEELENFVEAGISPAEALAASTREAARFMGELKEWGTVEVGKRADLVLLQGNPMESVANIRGLTGVMVRGRWLPSVRLQALLATLKH
jgi:imidazolonepropionase-like amidohydrolase